MSVHLVLLQFRFRLNFYAADVAAHACVLITSVDVTEMQLLAPKLRKPFARAKRALVDFLATMHSVVDFSFIGSSESLAASFVLADKRPLVVVDHHVHRELRFVTKTSTAAKKINFNQNSVFAKKLITHSMHNQFLSGL